VSHERTATGLESPRTTFTPAVAPASALIYSGKLFPQFKGNLFFGGLRGEGLFRVELTETGNVISYEKLANVTFGRIRDVVEAPTGEDLLLNQQHGRPRNAQAKRRQNLQTDTGQLKSCTSLFQRVYLKFV